MDIAAEDSSPTEPNNTPGTSLAWIPWIILHKTTKNTILNWYTVLEELVSVDIKEKREKITNCFCQ